ncbi:hypothetical protein P154DRAFT_408136, partial [Amniculicola lignicola CBS 123094]
SARGGWAGRGQYFPKGGGGAHTFTVPDTHKNPLGDIVTTISVSDLNEPPKRFKDTAKISDCQYVASYNWLAEISPTIAVPGQPAAWTPLKEPRRLKEDSGDYFRDINSAMLPSHPAEPAVKVVLESDPGIPLSGVDIFACGSTFGNLLRLVQSVPKGFRFGVEVIGGTVFFSRKENDPRELLEGVRGYGHTFPEAYTTWEGAVKGSQTHQRIIQYGFGGLKCLVRFECDGYIKDLASSDVALASTLDFKTTDYDLHQTLQATMITQPPQTIGDDVTIKCGGTVVPQKSIFDLKTRSHRKKESFTIDEFIPQLWVKQIPNFIVAFHQSGLFRDPEIHNVKDDILKWEADKQADLQRLAVLIHKIVDIAHIHDDELLEVYRAENSSDLQIRRQYGEGSQTLSPVTKAAWVQRSDFGHTDTAGGQHEESDPYEDDWHDGDDWDAASDGSERDFTACSADDCGYCGKCSY